MTRSELPREADEFLQSSAFAEKVDAQLAHSQVIGDRIEYHLDHSPRVDERIDRSASLRQRVVDEVLRSPYFGAKLYPTAGAATSYVVPNGAARPAGTDPADAPVPPADWLAGWGGYDVFHWGGKQDVGIMREVVAANGFTFSAGSRVLELGCSRGRMMRWLCDVAATSEIWGVDVVAEDVTWCHQNLSPPMHFATTTSFPHLPFEDGYFDLVYAGSVFTHISDLADAWVLELRRIVRPGGKLYLTVHDNNSVRILYDRGHVANNPWWREVMAEYEKVTEKRPLADFKTVVLLRGGPSMEQVFYDRDYIQQHWGRYLKYLALREEAYSAFQTALLFEKR